MSTNNLNIFNFDHYREYLLAHVESRKSKGYNVSRFSSDIGVGDVSTINKILKGQRHPGSALTTKLCEFFKLNTREEKYFRDLVALAKEKDSSPNKSYIIERLENLRPKNFQRQLSNVEFNIIAHWHYLAIREMLNLKDFYESTEWILKRLKHKVPPSKIEQALKSLLQIGLISRDKKGQLMPGEHAFETSQDIANEAIKIFHEEVLDLAKTAIRNTAVKERHIAGITLAISKDKLTKAKKLIDTFQDDFAKLLEDNKGDEVYQLNVQFFPLTQENSCPIQKN